MIYRKPVITVWRVSHMAMPRDPKFRPRWWREQLPMLRMLARMSPK